MTIATSPAVAGGPVLSGDPAPARGIRQVVGRYVALTKPRIIELLLVTTLPVMILAAGGLPHLWTAVATLIGGTLAAGSANTLNCVVDRDIDAVMSRTKRRPMARHEVPPVAALRFGIVLGAAATLAARTRRSTGSRPGSRTARSSSTSSSTPWV